MVATVSSAVVVNDRCVTSPSRERKTENKNVAREVGRGDIKSYTIPLY